MSQTLSASHQKKLQRIWNARIESPFAFIPTKVVEKGITPESAAHANERLAGFAVDFLKKILAESTPQDIERRRSTGAKIVAVGCGRGYDLDWLPEAVAASLQTIWLDVSTVACEMAIENVNSQFYRIPSHEELPHLRPLVKVAELRSSLADPESIDLDIDSVELWYMCRVLGCLSKASARVVLKQLGWHIGSDRNKGIIFVGALRDHNRNYTGSKNSSMPTVRSILSNLHSGAGNEFDVVASDSCDYFEKTVSALFIKPK